MLCIFAQRQAKIIKHEQKSFIDDLRWLGNTN